MTNTSSPQVIVMKIDQVNSNLKHRQLGREDGAIIVTYAIGIIGLVMLVALASKSWWLYIEDLRMQTIADISARAAVEGYISSSQPDFGGKFADGQVIAVTMISENWTLMKVGAFSQDPVPVPPASVQPGIWDLAHADTCNAETVECFTPSADITQINAFSVWFDAPISSAKLFGGILPGGSVTVRKRSIFAFDQYGVARKVFDLN